jgi:hypothetical protein
MVSVGTQRAEGYRTIAHSPGRMQDAAADCHFGNDTQGRFLPGERL